ncbi:MAG TPA: CHAT domain-containing protein [Candidatus Krumholzibacteria bacterium]|nr:CHAT domain-containing protein [Candidatus Krumholzibacteria bacterium]
MIRRRFLRSVLATGLLLAARLSAASPLDLAAQNEEIAVLYSEGRYADGVALTRTYLQAWTDSLGADSPEACSMASNLGPLLTQLGDWEAAETAHREAIACLERTFGPESEDLASALNNYGSHLGYRADFGRAEVALRESLRLLRLHYGEDHAYVAITLNNLGVNQQNQGNPVAAERTMRDAAARLRASLGADHPVTATAVNNLGRLLAAREAYAEAEPLLREALAVRDSVLGPTHPETSIGRRDLGRLRLRQERYVEAEADFRAALAAFLAERGPEHADIAMSRHELARALAGQDRRAEARAEFEAALALSARLYDPGHSSLIQIPRELGSLALADGRPADALLRFQAACDAFEAGRARSGDGLSRATYVENPWRHLAAARLITGDPDGAWAALIRSQGRVLADALYPEGAPALVLPAATAVIGWLDLDAGDGPRAWAWCLRRGAVRWHELPDAGSLTPAARALRDALAAPGSPARLRPLARDLYERRLAPLEEDLAGVTHLVTVPADGMLGVPIGALVDDRDRWLADRWTLSSTPSPAMLAWLHGRPPAAGARALLLGDPRLRPVPADLALARRPTDEVIRGAAHGLSEDLALLPDLPGTRLEVETLAAAWTDPLVLLGDAASESALADLAAADALRDFRVLHFATHALTDPEDADASALVLSRTDLPDPLRLLADGGRVTDGLVTAGEIAADWRLDADLVTLSACNSALGRAVEGEGLVGLAHALLRVGARGVLVSQWSVPDRATQIFMDAFYDAWRSAGRPRAEALAAARRALRDHVDADGRRPYGHPYFWAPFVLVGDER